MKAIIVLAAVGLFLTACGQGGNSAPDTVGAQSNDPAPGTPTNAIYEKHYTSIEGNEVFIFSAFTPGHYQTIVYTIAPATSLGPNGQLGRHGTYRNFVASDVVAGVIHQLTKEYSTCTMINHMAMPETYSFRATYVGPATGDISLDAPGTGGSVEMSPASDIMAAMGSPSVTEDTACVGDF